MTIGVDTESITDPTQASLMFEQRRKNVLNAYDTLNKIVERHEATIQKRWLGKTRPAKLKILLKAWPDMPLLHRPDLKALRQILSGNRQAAQWQQAALKWPHISQEDLAKPRTLLLLLNARSRNHPRVFADMDLHALALGANKVALERKFDLGPDYLVNMADASTCQGYGQLQYAKTLPSQPKPKQPPLFSPSQAFLVLEVQERMLKFLAGVCRFVLHDIAPGAMITDDEAYPVQPEPRLTTEASTGPFESMAAVAAEANYRAPRIPNFDQMESLLAARAVAAKDRVVALREDPGYFAAALQDIYEHSIQQVRLSDGSEHPDLKELDGSVVWLQAIKHIVATSYIRAEMYAELYMQSCSLRKLVQNMGEAELGGTTMATDEYVYALARLRYYLRRALHAPLKELSRHLHPSPLLRDMYVILCDDDIAKDGKSPNKTYLEPKDDSMSQFGIGSNKANAATLFFWAVKALVYDGLDIDDVVTPSLVDEMQRALNQESIGSDVITPFLASIIGDVSVLSHCLRMLRHMQPFADAVPAGVKAAVEREFGANFNPLQRLFDALDFENVHGAASLVNPSNGCFAYPADKRRTKETAEAMQRAEQNLDEFWAYIDQVMYRKAGCLEQTVLQEMMANPKAMRRTREWAEPSAGAANTAMVANGNGNGKTNGGGKKKKAGNKAAKANAAAAPVVGSNAAASTADSEPHLVPLSPFFYDLYKGKAANGSAEPDGSNESSTRSCYGSNGSHTANGTSIKVDSRALKVFRALYFHPDGSSTFGEIPWNDFVNAMSSVGFQAEKMYGSLWHFRPTKQGVAGVNPSTGDSIMFCDPFPQTKIAFDGARWIGRRLTRAYGWNRDTFVAKGK